MTSHALRNTVKELLCALHSNFGRNVEALSPETTPLLNSVDLNSRVISEAGNELSANYCSNDAHKRICTEILDEVFSDFSLAMYLCTIGLIVPARMSVRRAFELGLASVYMWDLPHEYWGWRQRDQDLSFSIMIAHLNSPGYLEYLTQLKGGESSFICDQVKFQDIYRQLSNTVHGKNTGLPPLSPGRFATDWIGLTKQLQLIEDAQKCVIQLLFGRFQELEARIAKTIPQIKRS